MAFRIGPILLTARRQRWRPFLLSGHARGPVEEPENWLSRSDSPGPCRGLPPPVSCALFGARSPAGHSTGGLFLQPQAGDVGATRSNRRASNAPPASAAGSRSPACV